MRFYASAFHVLGALRSLEEILDTANDSVGLALMDEQVPQRVRQARAPERP